MAKGTICYENSAITAKCDAKAGVSQPSTLEVNHSLCGYNHPLHFLKKYYNLFWQQVERNFRN